MDIITDRLNLSGAIVTQIGGTLYINGSTITGGPVANIVYTTGNQLISGLKTFSNTIGVTGFINATGDITSNSNLVEKRLEFTPSTIGWYRILYGAQRAGGIVRITSDGIYDNTFTDVEVHFNLAGYGQPCSLIQTRGSNYQGGCINQIRASTDGSANCYLDVYVSTATTPKPVICYFYGPELKAATFTVPTVGAVAGSSNQKILTLTAGLNTTEPITIRNHNVSGAIVYIAPGDNSNNGWIQWNKPNNDRIAYLGHGGTANLNLTLENSAKFFINGGDIDIDAGRNYLSGTIPISNLFYPRTNPSGYLTSATVNNLINVSPSSNYTINSTESLIRANSAGGSITLTLPNATTVSGKQYIIKKISNDVNAVTITGVSSQRIDDMLGYNIYNRFEALNIVSFGTGWDII